MRNPKTIKNRSSVAMNEIDQQGFILIVAMLFLIVLTSLGISALNTSHLGERMAGNMQHDNVSFQGAETGLAFGLSGAANATTDDTEENSAETTYIVNGVISETESTDKATITVTTTTAYKVEGNNPPKGFSLDGPFATHYFALTSDARYGKTRSQLGKGFYRVGPSSQD